MAKHIDTGKTGEKMAINWLRERGYAILEQNWRHARWEVDVIAEKEMVLHFIEIKTRRSWNFGLPEDSVGKNRRALLERMAKSREAPGDPAAAAVYLDTKIST